MRLSPYASAVLVTAGLVFVSSACGTTSKGGAGGKTQGTGTGTGGACGDTGERPGGRAEGSAVVDEKRQKLVFFGGDIGLPKQCMPNPRQVGETWVYDERCKTFTQVMATSGPGPRTRAAAAYDVTGDRMIVFGGRYRAAATGNYTLYADVWALDLNQLTWTELDQGGGGPTARSSTVAAFDSMKGEFIVYAGNASNNGLAFNPLGDVWAFNVATSAWRQIMPTGSAPAMRLFHSAAIDVAGRRLFIYGGGDANAFTGPFLGDLWSLNIDTGVWTELAKLGSGPRARIESSLAFDTASGTVLLFGGHDDGPVGNNNDTWSFDPAQGKWTSIVPAETVHTAPSGFCNFPAAFTVPNLGAPDRRSAPVAGFDQTHRVLTLFGGDTDCGLIDDVWAFDAAKASWSSEVAALSGEACTRGPNPGACTSLCQ